MKSNPNNQQLVPRENTMSAAVATVEDKPMPAVRVEESNLVAIIARAAADPAVDVAKMERLLEMQERIEARQAKVAYTQALVVMKPKLPVVERNGKIVIPDKNDKSKIIQSTPYALWEDLDAAITPILHDHGFVLTFRTGSAPDGKVTVTGILSHDAGHSEETTITLPLDTSGSKNNVQGVGSALSYGKRYSATMLLNIRTKGQDDDGKLAGDAGLISEDQIATLREMLERTDSDVEKFCAYFKIDALPDLKAKDYERAIAAINLKDKKAGAK